MIPSESRKGARFLRKIQNWPKMSDNNLYIVFKTLETKNFLSLWSKTGAKCIKHSIFLM